MGSHHNHDHHHHHPSEFNKAFFIATLANSVFVVIQITYALIANSNSLLADGFHNLGDVLSLILAWIANSLIQRKPTQTASYGFKKSSILAAFANGGLLIFTCGIIVTEAAYKFFTPEPIETGIVLVVASIGILVNGATALLFLKGQHDLNIRGAYLHLLYDALVSVGVVIAALLMMLTGWLWLDPLMGLLITYVILKGTWALFKDSLHLMMDAVPRHISLAQVKSLLESLPGVQQVHDVHIWALSTQENALSAHLWMPKETLSDQTRAALIEQLKTEHHIQHVTIQVEKELLYCEDSCTTHSSCS
ncbi:cation diffusion facilitator family transporter [Legionella sp. W05-934-2]|jgi:cobalt-zinc-cadmium efflux system protein|uniref:cation diffusion facilitator family transporter n=1 Tax=Legionella sp. W05-934-2 TaxID=1198649 RepID=UPI0034618E5F